MKKLAKVLFLILLLSAICYPLTATYAAVPHLINYQGRLTDKSNKPLDGAYNLTLRIFDAVAAGNLLWEETQQGVLVQKGVFSIMLGSRTNLDLPFDKQYYLEIKVGDEVMSPRQALTSVGYSIKAEKAEKADALTIPAQQGDILYFNGSNWVRLGAGTAGKYLKTMGASANPAWGLQMDSGVTPTCGNQSVESKVVSFNITFVSPPKVVVTPNDVNIGGLSSFWITNITTTGFTINTGNNYSATYNWIAIGCN